MTLLTETISLAKSISPKTRKAACEHVGCTERWLQQVIAGQINDPGVTKIETLYKYLCLEKQTNIIYNGESKP